MQTKRPNHNHPWNLSERLCKLCGKHVMSKKNRMTWTCTKCRHSYYQPHTEQLVRPSMEEEFLRELERRR